MPNDAAEITWSGDASASTVGRLCLYVQVGFFGGLALLLAALVGLLAVRSVRTGEYGVLALVALLALVGGPFSLLYLLPVVTDPDARHALSEDLPRYHRIDRWKLALAAVLGAGGILAAVYAGSWLVLVTVLLVPMVSFGVAGTLDADGALDAAAGTLVVGDAETDLDAVAEVRRIDLGSHAVLWLSCAGPNDLGSPRLVVVPRSVADAAVAAVPEDLGASEDPRPAAERAALVGTAAVFLGLAAVLVAVGRGTENAAALYAFAAMPGSVGALLLYLAA